MRSILLILVCIASFLAGILLTTFLKSEDIAALLYRWLPWAALVAGAALILMGMVLWVGYFYLRRRLLGLNRNATGLLDNEVAAGLVDFVTTTEGVSNPTPADQRRAALVNGLTWMMRHQATQLWFNYTITIMGGLVGAATLFLLFEQNAKLDVQNEKLDEQNRKVTLQTDATITQALLLEGSRRAQLSGQLTALVEEIADEAQLQLEGGSKSTCGPNVSNGCWQVFSFANYGEVTKYQLSTKLKVRVSSFLASSAPYHLTGLAWSTPDFDRRLNEQVEFFYLSPEKATILDALISNDVLVDGMNFGEADLRSKILSGAFLRGASLGLANLESADLRGANVMRTDFTGAVLTDTVLIGVDASAANFAFSDMSGSDLSGGVFSDTNFTGSDLSLADLRSTDLKGAALIGVNLTEALLQGADLDRADFSRSYIIVDPEHVGRRWEGVDFPGDETVGNYWPFGLPKNIPLFVCKEEPIVSDEDGFQSCEVMKRP